MHVVVKALLFLQTRVNRSVDWVNILFRKWKELHVLIQSNNVHVSTGSIFFIDTFALKNMAKTKCMTECTCAYMLYICMHASMYLYLRM